MSGRPDLNRRPSPWEGDVLPAELLPQYDFRGISLLLYQKAWFEKIPVEQWPPSLKVNNRGGT